MADYRYTRHAKQTGADSETQERRDDSAGSVGPVEPAAGVAVLRSEAPDPADPLGGTTAPDDVVEALRRRRGAGKPLSAKDASRFGESYGTDLSGVRVHTDGEADVLARSVGAAAFTYGSDVYFAGNSPTTGAEGERLLAHELAHVAQGSGGGASSGSAPVIGRAADPHEADADRMADSALSQMRSNVAAPPAAEAPAVHRMTTAELTKLHEEFIAKAAGDTKLDDLGGKDGGGGGEAKTDTKTDDAKVEEQTETETEEGTGEEGKTEEGKTEEGKTEETTEGETEEGKTEGETEEGGTEEGKTEEGKTEEGKTEGGNETGENEEGKTEEEEELDSAEIDGKTETKVQDAAGEVQELKDEAGKELEEAAEEGGIVPQKLKSKDLPLEYYYEWWGLYSAAANILRGSKEKSSSEQHKLRENVLTLLAGDRQIKTLKELKFPDFVTFVGNRRDKLLFDADEAKKKLIEEAKESASGYGSDLTDDTADELGEDLETADETDEEATGEQLLAEAKQPVGIDGGLLLHGEKPIDTSEDEAPVNGTGWERFAVGQENDLHLIPKADEEIKVDDVIAGEDKFTGEISVDDGIIKGMSGDAVAKPEELVEFLRGLQAQGMSLDFELKGLAGPKEQKALHFVESQGAEGGSASSSSAESASEEKVSASG